MPVTSSEVSRAANLVEQYASLPLGTADAFVVAVAEKYRAVNIATLDRRHFTWCVRVTSRHSLCCRSQAAALTCPVARGSAGSWTGVLSGAYPCGPARRP